MVWLALLTACKDAGPTPHTGDTGDVPVGPVVIEPSPLRHGDSPLCVENGVAVDAQWAVDGVAVTAGPTLDLTPWPGQRVSCSTAAGTAEVAVQGGNILVVMTDDQGVDWMGAYGEGDARTPTLDRLASEGLLFRRAYAQPLCSPTRAALLTGRWAFRTGIGDIVITEVTEPTQLPDDELTIAEHLKANAAGYHTRLLGKWHLGEMNISGFDQPNRQGFDYYSGTYVGIWSYYDWLKTTNGIQVPSSGYVTTETTDDAVDAVQTMPEPWLLGVFYNAPHEPLDLPPDSMHTYEGVTEDDTPFVRMGPVVEALDGEISRILDALGPVEQHTTIVFLSDNGTPNHIMVERELPYGGKSTVRETGARVPFVVKGPVVRNPGTETYAMVHAIDLFPTIAALAGVPDTPPVDGLSLRPVLDGEADTLHDHMLIERFGPNGGEPYTFWHRGLRDARYKLIRFAPDNESLYDLEGLEREGTPIPTPYTGDALAAYERLSQMLDHELVAQ
ncbi:MAG: sulfatase-like hydrolase/transferase [Alphaproteobacteria bacterium]|nr:sulfatase-like hydrolase/transferase [Alphaproteobacteria bacterium]